ncbi:MAG: VCBS repeat-containing protein [Acidobacteria bacterium]|nr:VCBS repeat-containing protein [Acidobacteriota bacterium]
MGGSYGDSPTISVFRNISAGTGTITFGPRIDIPVGTFRVVAAADFDGDTKIDFVVAGGIGGAFRVFRNTGSGNGDISFSAPATFEDTTNVTGVTVLDVDGDSKPEIAVSASRTVVIYPNTGSGLKCEFRLAIHYSNGIRPVRHYLE